MNNYLIFVYDDIEPEIWGPYPNKEMRDDVALKLRKEFGKSHGLYPLTVDNNGKPTIKAYSASFFMGLSNEPQ